jgi:L-lactate dehydrogenase complex protein LldG
MISSKQGSGKAAILNAKILVVIAFTDQLVFDMKEALNMVKKKYNGSFPNMLSVITNPVNQMNGPTAQELYVLLIENG